MHAISSSHKISLMREIPDSGDGLTLWGAQPDPHEAPSGLIDLLKHIQQEASFYRVMLGAQGDPLFAQRFRQKTEKRFLSCFHQAFPECLCEPDAPPLDLRFTIIASAGCG